MIDAVFATPVYKSDNLYKLTKEQLDYLQTLEMIKTKAMVPVNKSVKIKVVII